MEQENWTEEINLELEFRIEVIVSSKTIETLEAAITQ